jgi:hypothetical protein
MKKTLNNQKGQTVVEGVLLLLVFVTLATIVSREFRDNQLLARMVSAPWDRLSGMIQNGVWEVPDESNSKHPAHIDRHLSTIE